MRAQRLLSHKETNTCACPPHTGTGPCAILIDPTDTGRVKEMSTAMRKPWSKGACLVDVKLCADLHASMWGDSGGCYGATGGWSGARAAEIWKDNFVFGFSASAKDLGMEFVWVLLDWLRCADALPRHHVLRAALARFQRSHRSHLVTQDSKLGRSALHVRACACLCVRVCVCVHSRMYLVIRTRHTQSHTRTSGHRKLATILSATKTAVAYIDAADAKARAQSPTSRIPYLSHRDVREQPAA